MQKSLPSQPKKKIELKKSSLLKKIKNTPRTTATQTRTVAHGQTASQTDKKIISQRTDTASGDSTPAANNTLPHRQGQW